MARKENQKQKLLYLARIFREETDENHGLTMPQLVRMLENYGVSAERKVLYQDMEILRDFGMDIITCQEGRSYTYRLASREFELAELKLLVDSVQSSKFISEKKSNALIRKLEQLTSRHEADQLHRQVLITGRVKSMNESTYYNVDDIHNAINRDRKLKFRYVSWTVDKRESLRRDGSWYEVSPLHLRWDDEYYYLIAYNAETDDIRHYRVDKMKNVCILDLPRDGKDRCKDFDPAAYSRKLFGMFAGESHHVTLLGENSMIGVLIDRFGKDIPVIRKDEDHFEAVVEAAVSPQFFGWIASLGSRIRITSPQPVVDEMRRFTDDLRRLYR